jgi:hypothetical protein
MCLQRPNTAGNEPQTRPPHMCASDTSRVAWALRPHPPAFSLELGVRFCQYSSHFICESHYWVQLAIICNLKTRAQYFFLRRSDACRKRSLRHLCSRVFERESSNVADALQESHLREGAKTGIRAIRLWRTQHTIPPSPR